MSVQIILSEHHPFIKVFDISTWRLPNGMWQLKWRDFASQPQNVAVRRFSDAQSWVSYIAERARTLTEDDLDQLDCCGESVESMTSWWASVMDKAPKRQ